MLYRVTNINELFDCVGQTLNPSPTKSFSAYVQGNLGAYGYADQLRVKAKGTLYSRAIFEEFDKAVKAIHASLKVPMIVGFEDINNYADDDWPYAIDLFPRLMAKQGITRLWNVYVNVFDESIPVIRDMGKKQILTMFDAGDIGTGVIIRDNWLRWDLRLDEVVAEIER